ncbi:MAG: type II toxin-antitoxin system RelE/ParE family toxin [Flavobacteriales bacterium]|nr:type II toxin-antitoxin system RelE/ParE family toxin [Flavobacteriales bacterium]
MAYKLVVTTDTGKDIDKATEWYVNIRKPLAKRFLAELFATKKYIHKNPNKLETKYKNVRVAFMRKFPYGLHYTFENKTVTILAVFHTSENPTNWRNR